MRRDTLLARFASALCAALLALASRCGAREASVERASPGSAGAGTPASHAAAGAAPGDEPASGTGGASPTEPGEPRCFGAVADRGVLLDPRLGEVSGLVASRREPGVLWAHNDSGEPSARFFALGLDGTTRAEIEIEGAPHVDWEDVALFAAPDGRELLYFADTGDNGARDGSIAPRDHVEVVVVEPPTLPPGVAPATLRASTFESLAFRYPDGPRDCEAIFVDAATGDLYLLSKTNEGPHALYRDAAPHAPTEMRTLERVMELLTGRSLADGVTGADASASGDIAIRTYRQALYFARPASRAVRDALLGTPVEIPHLHERQGEAIALSADGTGIFTVSEGDAETLHFVPFVPCP